MCIQISLFHHPQLHKSNHYDVINLKRFFASISSFLCFASSHRFTLLYDFEAIIYTYMEGDNKHIRTLNRKSLWIESKEHTKNTMLAIARTQKQTTIEKCVGEYVRLMLYYIIYTHAFAITCGIYMNAETFKTLKHSRIHTIRILVCILQQGRPCYMCVFECTTITSIHPIRELC